MSGRVTTAEKCGLTAVRLCSRRNAHLRVASETPPAWEWKARSRLASCRPQLPLHLLARFRSL